MLQVFCRLGRFGGFYFFTQALALSLNFVQTLLVFLRQSAVSQTLFSVFALFFNVVERAAEVLAGHPPYQLSGSTTHI